MDAKATPVLRSAIIIQSRALSGEIIAKSIARQAVKVASKLAHRQSNE